MQDSIISRPPEITNKEPTSLMVFPSLFPIKVLGRNVEALIPSMCAIALEFDPSFHASSIELRSSKAGNYLGITLNVTATSQQQLDALYTRLSSHVLVKVVL